MSRTIGQGRVIDELERAEQASREPCAAHQSYAMAYGIMEIAMGRGLLLWLIGIPIPIILLVWLFGGLHG
jgi:hypothetical protein